jgi:hypothetical protein
MPELRRRKTHANPTRSGDDSGCLLVILFLLWSLGFLSFHSRDTGRALERVAELKSELATTETKLADLTRVVRELSVQSDMLGSHRDSLERQVKQLNQARDQVALSLRAASALAAPSPAGRWQALGETVFSGVLGNLISALLVAGIGWFFGRRSGLGAARPTDADASSESASSETA